MVIETEPLTLLEWFPVALVDWLLIVAVVGATAVLAGFVIATVRHGPGKAGDLVFGVLKRGAGDLIFISPRRVWALARLAVQESMRRSVLAAFAVFIMILMFALWLVQGAGNEPAPVYLNLVMWTSRLLVLLIVLFLSAFSLPMDIARHTIYTIVTKPVRPSEIVLGRILGFSLVGTAVLAATGVISYFFVVRGLDHGHEIRVAGGDAGQAVAEEAEYTGLTSVDGGHRHAFRVDGQGQGAAEPAFGHRHAISAATDAQGARRLVIGSPQGSLQARSPIYGKIRFKDRTGADAERGVNVGDEWTYRSYIAGGSSAEAIWAFDGMLPERFPEAQFPESIPIEMTIEVFRTHKGEIEQGILGGIQVRNPATGLTSAEMIFTAHEGDVDRHELPRAWQDAEGAPIDLFDDLAADGRLEVVIRCLDPQQYFGMAQADLYFLAGQRPFLANFFKGYLGVWFQMVAVACLGVFWSTFLNAAVSIFATGATVLFGYLIEHLKDLTVDEPMDGGGLFESGYRMVTQVNMVSELSPGLGTMVLQRLDDYLQIPLRTITSLLPDLSAFSRDDYVIHGYDIPLDSVAISALQVTGFGLALFVAGYFFLKLREVAK